MKQPASAPEEGNEVLAADVQEFSRSLQEAKQQGGAMGANVKLQAPQAKL